MSLQPPLLPPTSDLDAHLATVPTPLPNSLLAFAARLAASAAHLTAAVARPRVPDVAAPVASPVLVIQLRE